MSVYPDSFIVIILPFLVMLGTVSALIAFLLLMLRGRFHAALKIAVVTMAGFACYVVAINAVSLLSPQTVVKPGESHCFDIWCLGVDRVSSQSQGQTTLYRIDVHIFSDANTVKVSSKGTTPYLIDASGRRFPMIADPAVVPFDSVLDPRQSIATTLTFAVAQDARPLFLAGDDASGPPFPLTYLVGRFYKPTLFRIL